MKGVVFTEFFGLVEQQFSADMVDDLIDATAPASGGAYTAVGTYDHHEIVAMVVELSSRSGIAVPDLLHAFGRHLLGRFYELYPAFFERVSDTFGFLASIDDVIHVEVLKLHPDAELPRFEHRLIDEHTMELVYRSARHMEDLAAGLIAGCADHFGESVSVLTDVRADGAVAFVIARSVDVVSLPVAGSRS